MALTNRESAKLRQFVAFATQLLEKYSSETEATAKSAAKGNQRRGKASASGKAQEVRVRRTGKELLAFRKMLKAERKRGVPVAELAETHGVSTAYIYQVK